MNHDVMGGAKRSTRSAWPRTPTLYTTNESTDESKRLKVSKNKVPKETKQTTGLYQ